MGTAPVSAQDSRKYTDEVTLAVTRMLERRGGRGKHIQKYKPIWGKPNFLS